MKKVLKIFGVVVSVVVIVFLLVQIYHFHIGPVKDYITANLFSFEPNKQERRIPIDIGVAVWRKVQCIEGQEHPQYKVVILRDHEGVNVNIIRKIDVNEVSFTVFPELGIAFETLNSFRYRCWDQSLSQAMQERREFFKIILQQDIDPMK